MEFECWVSGKEVTRDYEVACGCLEFKEAGRDGMYALRNTGVRRRAS